MKFHVAVYYDEETNLYWGKIIEIENVYSQGKSINELISNIKEALKLHLESGKVDIGMIVDIVEIDA